ncbi:hypothetical protein PT077_09020, partial [Erysipelothrix rhusiopathiae]|nr:hypothetical protein [Erysipelothrix rhusiopathiae]
MPNDVEVDSSSDVIRPFPLFKNFISSIRFMFSNPTNSTTLRTIAGFNTIRSGTFYVEDKKMNDVKINDRDFGMVFQSY